MPKNNNQKVPSAAARLAKMPMILSVCTKLSVLYIDTKGSHPNLRSVCEVLESSVTAVVSPVLVKLEPQIFVANDVACKGLDWLETAFPVLHTPTEQIVASAKNKMHEIQDVVSVAVHGTMDCVEHTVAWLRCGIQQVGVQADQSCVEKAIIVASVGLDSALLMSEALVDRVLPPTEEDEEEEDPSVEGFEAASLGRRYPLRLVSLAAKLCRRTYHMVGSKMQYVQAMEILSSGLVQDLQTKCLTVAWSIHVLPQYVQHQLASVFFFVTQMYNLGCPPPKYQQSHHDRSSLNATETSTRMVLVHSQAKPPCRMRPTKMPVFSNGSNANGSLR